MDNDPDFQPIQDSDFQPETSKIGSGLRSSKLGQLLGAALGPTQALREGFVKGASLGKINSLYPGAESAPNTDVNRASRFMGEQGSELALGEAVGAPLLKGAAKIAKPILDPIGSKLMEVAMGMGKKTLPGSGKVALKEGIWGTKGQMAKQAQRATDRALTEMESKVGQMTASSPEATERFFMHNPAAESVEKVRGRFYTSGGQPLSGAAEAEPVINAYKAEILKRKPSTPTELLEFKRGTNPLGYSEYTGQPLESLKAELAQAEGAGYGQQLAEEWAKMHPESPSDIADLNYKASRLLSAKTAASHGGSSLDPLVAILTKGKSLLKDPAISGAAQLTQFPERAAPAIGRVAPTIEGLQQKVIQQNRQQNQDPDFEPIE